MRRKARCFFPLLFTLPALAQKPSPQQVVTITVADVHTDHPQPVAAVIVSLGSLDGVSFGNSSTTSKGEAFLHVSSDTAQRDDLRIEIRTDANPAARDLVIFEPADGQVHGLAQTLPIKLLPKGSPLLAGNAQIEAAQRRLSQRVSVMQRQISQQQNEIRGLQAQAAAAQSQSESQKQDLNAGLEEWAKANGLELADVQKKVQDWAKNIQVDPAATAERRALAEFALKNFKVSGDDFGEARRAMVGGRELRKKQQQEQDRMELQKELETGEAQAKSYQLSALYHDATAAMEETRDDLAEQRKASPQVRAIATIWMESVSATAKARELEAEVVDPSLVAGLLKQSEADFKNVEAQYTAIGDKRGAADAARDRAGVMVALTSTTEYTHAVDLLEQAIPIYRSVLTALTRTDDPEDWATTQVDLGHALLQMGERKIEDPAAFLPEAVSRYKSALEVFTRSDHPREWANINKDIGEALSIEGELTEGEPSANALQAAAEALLNALDVLTEIDNPQDWAATQVRRGYALTALGKRSTGEAARTAINQAIDCYTNALRVYTKETLPQPWADAELHLGWGQAQLVSFVEGDASIQLLRRAIQSLSHYLEVHTMDNDPAHWVIVESDIAKLHRDIAAINDPKLAKPELDQALEIYRATHKVQLKSDDPEEPYAISSTERDIGNTLMERASLLDRDDALRDLSEAETTLRHSLTVLSDYCRGKKWETWLEQTWIQIATSLNRAGIALGHERLSTAFFETPLKGATDPIAAIKLFTDLYHEQLFRFERAFELNQQLAALDSSSGQMLNLMEASFTAGHFEICLEQSRALSGVTLDPPYKLVRDLLRTSCSVALGHKIDALTSEKTLLTEIGALHKDGWNFTGTLHYVRNSPEFGPGRAAWIALFSAVQNGDSAAMTLALHDLEPLFQP